MDYQNEYNRTLALWWVNPKALALRYNIIYGKKRGKREEKKQRFRLRAS